jgi:hypothetical protein
VRHLYHNFHKLHKGEDDEFWAVARSTNIPMWKKNTEKMKIDSATLGWIDELPPNICIKAFFLVTFQTVTC